MDVQSRSHGRIVLRLVLCPLLAALLIVPAGCGQGRAEHAPGNLSITVERGFVKRQAAYGVWPHGDDSLFSSHGGGGGGGGGNWNFGGGGGGNGEGVVVLIAIVVAAVVLAETIDVTYHNVHGLQLTVTIEGEAVYQSFPLRWGENHLQISPFSLARLADGSAALFLSGTGTRHLRLLLPTAGLDWERETHTIALLGSGELVADGRAVAMPPPPPIVRVDDAATRGRR